MTCNVQSLMNDAAGFASLDPGQLNVIRTVLLCRLWKATNPMANCDPQALMNDAACFACLPAGTLLVIQTQLLCNLTGGGGGGSGSTQCGAVDPVAAPVGGCGTFYNTTTGKFLAWNPGTGVWDPLIV